jgi:hypothetical protein
MTAYTLTTLNTSIETTLATATGIIRSQDIDEISEQIPNADLPLLMVYPQSWGSAKDSDTNKNTFGGSQTPLQIMSPIFHADVYVAPVGQKISETMALYATIAQAITDVLNAQQLKPLFADSAIENFTWDAEKVVINYSNVDYVGIRFTINLVIF